MLPVLIKPALPSERVPLEQYCKACREGPKETAALTSQNEQQKGPPSPGQRLDFPSGPRPELRNPGPPPVSRETLFSSGSKWMLSEKSLQPIRLWKAAEVVSALSITRGVLECSVREVQPAFPSRSPRKGKTGEGRPAQARLGSGSQSGSSLGFLVSPPSPLPFPACAVEPTATENRDLCPRSTASEAPDLEGAQIPSP